MLATGYLVFSIDGSPSISRAVTINTDSIFMRAQFDDDYQESADPDHRAWLEGVLTLLYDSQAQLTQRANAPRPPDTF